MTAHIGPDDDVMEEIEQANRMLDDQSPQAVLLWAAGRYGEALTLACSFGGPTGMVLLDMTMEKAPGTEVFYLDNFGQIL